MNSYAPTVLVNDPHKRCRVCGGYEDRSGDSDDNSSYCPLCGSRYSFSYGNIQESIGEWVVEYGHNEDLVTMSKLHPAREVAILIRRWQCGIIPECFAPLRAFAEALHTNPHDFHTARVAADWVEEHFEHKEGERLAYYLRNYTEAIGFPPHTD